MSPITTRRPIKKITPMVPPMNLNICLPYRTVVTSYCRIIAGVVRSCESGTSSTAAVSLRSPRW